MCVCVHVCTVRVQIGRATSDPKSGSKKETAISPQCTHGITTKAHLKQTKPDKYSTP